MAYATYNEYVTVYFGNAIEETDFDKWISKASDELDIMTHNRLIDYYPTDATTIVKIKKCVCELAELLFDVNNYRTSLRLNSNGASGLIKSVSAGSESITYATTDSSYFKMVNDESALSHSLYKIALRHLTNQYDTEDTPVLLMYGGV